MITCNYLLAVSIRQKRHVKHEEEDGITLRRRKIKLEEKLEEGRRWKQWKWGQRGGSVGKAVDVGGQEWRLRRSAGGQRDREHGVDMCFCQTGSTGCCLSFRCCPSESASELISPSFEDMRQTSDSDNNCRVTNLLFEDSDAAFCTNHVIGEIVKCNTHRVSFLLHTVLLLY